MKNKITDIFFDLDHTLWDFEKNSALTFQKIFLKNKLDVNLDQFLESYIPINRKYWILFSQDKVLKEDLKYKRLQESFSKIEYKIEQKLIQQLSEDYVVHLSDHNFLFDDAHEVLKNLSSTYKLHIITNGFKEVQHLKLKNSKIDHYFNIIITSDDVGVKKPHPFIFESALGKANVNARASLMVGDNLEADIYGAERAGIESVLFDPENKIDHKGLKIKTLKELETLLN
ncbi:YjjG family noncanonical pyrimidine nucleotidase [Mesonia ostreae]|uniref:YjjG family noncanonical pyrimidine nucleotidase n=1 Tax=Mesonia ostreae TaxID=861110 RepID=A0ABU2KLF0_9FLAO|nr:YjjG family noncanonical pyrimidine nucleotidase [Mesonia ostreae]MDT0295536.1 YjjG family noncanonical pyrimidine nucleotidase [Mesonia ostreae]